MRLANGLFWPIPITLSAAKSAADALKPGTDVALVDVADGELLATMTVREKYTIDKQYECMSVFKTADLEHPGVRMVMDQSEVNLAGPVKVLSRRIPEQVRRSLHDSGADACRVRSQRLVDHRRVSDAQPDAPL